MTRPSPAARKTDGATKASRTSQPPRLTPRIGELFEPKLNRGVKAARTSGASWAQRRETSRTGSRTGRSARLAGRRREEKSCMAKVVGRSAGDAGDGRCTAKQVLDRWLLYGDASRALRRDDEQAATGCDLLRRVCRIDRSCNFTVSPQRSERHLANSNCGHT